MHLVIICSGLDQTLVLLMTIPDTRGHEWANVSSDLGLNYQTAGYQSENVIKYYVYSNYFGQNYELQDYIFNMLYKPDQISFTILVFGILIITLCL